MVYCNRFGNYKYDRDGIFWEPRWLEVGLPHDSKLTILTAERDGMWRSGFKINAFWFYDAHRKVGLDQREFRTEQQARYAAFRSAIRMMERWADYISEEEVYQTWDCEGNDVRRTPDQLEKMMRELVANAERYAHYFDEDSLFPMDDVK